MQIFRFSFLIFLSDFPIRFSFLIFLSDFSFLTSKPRRGEITQRRVKPYEKGQLPSRKPRRGDITTIFSLRDNIFH